MNYDDDGQQKQVKFEVGQAKWAVLIKFLDVHINTNQLLSFVTQNMRNSATLTLDNNDLWSIS